MSKDCELRVKQIIFDVLCPNVDSPKDLNKTANLKEDLLADSLDVVQMMGELEVEFEIELKDGLEADLHTVYDVIKHVEELLERTLNQTTH